MGMKILFIDGTQGYYPGKIDDKAAGGIVTSLHHIPRYLAAKGHDVSLITSYDKDDTVCGVKHYHKAPDLKPDVVIFNRNLFTHALVDRYRDAYKIWWLHDIVDPSYLEDNSYVRMDKIVALSNYCVDSYAGFYDLPKDRFTVIPNGVDKSIFYPGTADREHGLFVYASAPIKGMYPLYFALSNLKRNFPKSRLVMYSNQGMHGLKNTPEMERQFAVLNETGAEISEPIPQRELADVFRKAYALLMPNSYPEICSNILLQARACGLPVIASNIGSASEFIEHGHNGLLTHTRPDDLFWWHKDYAELCVKLALDSNYQEELSKNTPRGILDWNEVGGMWNKMLSKIKVGVA